MKNFFSCPNTKIVFRKHSWVPGSCELLPNLLLIRKRIFRRTVISIYNIFSLYMNLSCTVQIHRFTMDKDSCWKNQNKQNIMQVMEKP